MIFVRLHARYLCQTPAFICINLVRQRHCDTAPLRTKINEAACAMSCDVKLRNHRVTSLQLLSLYLRVL